MNKKPSLTFKVAPHAIQDLGTNLYSGFPKVLAEFVANAYDADANKVEIDFDFRKADQLKKLMRKHFQSESLEATSTQDITPLANRVLPESIFVEIRDDGFGMSEEELNDRFLFAARKRRELAELPRSNANRPLMGRKGLGKLAGFGAASLVEVISKKKDNKKAIHFTLDYEAILAQDTLAAIPIESKWDTTTFRPEESGTLIRLKRLYFEAIKSRSSTVLAELAEHFEYVDSGDFVIRLNGRTVPKPNRKFAFAWPEPELANNTLVSKSLETELGPISFEYRIRFRQDRKALPAERRGVRIYVHNRLASAPSLFTADTNMHGFRMTDYMDGVVRADFIDDQPQDYIATDRQSVRWDTQLLAPLKEFISEEIKEACKAYQAYRDKLKADEVGQDEFTLTVINQAELSKREGKFLGDIAVRLARYLKKGTEDREYKTILPQLAKALGNGTLYSSLSKLAEMESPDVVQLVADVVKLNRVELDGAMTIIKSRLKAIEALRNEINRPLDSPRNEKAIQQLFEEAPWLMNPLYKEYLTADKSLSTTLKKLQEHLYVEHPEIAGDIKGRLAREADFVFIIGSEPLREVVVIELKASTLEAEVDNVLQIREYMDTVSKWLADNGFGRVTVRGELICTPPNRSSKRREHARFWREVDKLAPSDDHCVRAYTKVLDDTIVAHNDILKYAQKVLEDPSELEE